MGKSNGKAFSYTASKTLFLGVFSLGCTSVAAEPTRLSWLVGTSSETETSKGRLWNRFEGEQWIGGERFFAAADIKTQSLLSASPKWGGGFGMGSGLSLGSSIEWLPSLRLEKDTSISGWDSVFQSALRYRLWTLLLDTQIAVGLYERADSRLFRFRQAVGMSLGESNLREDFVFLDLEFQDRLSSTTSPVLRSAVKRVGLVFASQVEF